jgi:hypothetical protein
MSNAEVPSLNIKIVDQDKNAVFYKIQNVTPLGKLMEAFCQRQGIHPSTVRFLYDGVRVTKEVTPETVCSHQLTQRS